MIECPECGEVLRGKRCRCGYEAPVQKRPAVDLDAIRERSLWDAQRAAFDWLAAHGLLQGDESRGDYMRRLAEYRKSLRARRRVAEIDPRWWARELVARAARGEQVCALALAMAKEVA